MKRRGRPTEIENGVRVCAVLSKRHIKDALELGGGNASKGLRMAIDRYKASLYPENALLRFCVAVEECVSSIDTAMDALEKTSIANELYSCTSVTERAISMLYDTIEKMGLLDKDEPL